jgi:hypothetical protein
MRRHVHAKGKINDYKILVRKPDGNGRDLGRCRSTWAEKIEVDVT